MARFTLPRDLYYGKGSLENLKNLSGKESNCCFWRKLYEKRRLS